MEECVTQTISLYSLQLCKVKQQRVTCLIRVAAAKKKSRSQYVKIDIVLSDC